MFCSKDNLSKFPSESGLQEAIEGRTCLKIALFLSVQSDHDIVTMISMKKGTCNCCRKESKEPKGSEGF